MYIYQAIIYKNPSEVLGLTSQGIIDNEANKTAFEGAGKKENALPISELQIAETAFVIEKTYDEFEQLIETPLSWSDVKYRSDDRVYQLFLVTENQL
jgi:hypothetical protein